jgi:hypothetical protein
MAVKLESALPMEEQRLIAFESKVLRRILYIRV